MQGNPFADLIPQRQQPNAVVVGTPNPRLARQEQRADEDQALQREAAARAAEANERANAASMRAAEAAERQAMIAAKKLTQEAKPSESERTAGFLATRIAGSLGDINRITKTNPDAASPELDTAILGGLLGRSTVNSSNRQRVEDAQLDVLDAALTLGTGAAYTREQLEGYRQSYFPQYWDSPEAVKDKESRLKRVLEAARIKAGAAAPMIDQALANSGFAPAQPTTSGAQQGDQGAAPIAKERQSLTIDNLADVATGLSGGTYDITEDGALTYNGQPINASAEVLNSDQVRDAYERKYGAPPPLQVDIEGGGAAPPDPRMQGRENAVLDPFVRGAADTLTLGGADELAAAGQTIFGGGTMRENLRAERAIDTYDERNNPVSRITGQVAGGFGLPTGGVTSARGLAGIGAGYSAGYGFGSNDGSLTDRLLNAGISAPVGAAAGFAGGRAAQFVQNRSRATPSGLDARAQDIAGAAERQGVRVLPADLGNSPLVNRLTSGTAQTPFGAGPINRAANESVDSFDVARRAAAELAGETNAERLLGAGIGSRTASATRRSTDAVADTRNAALGTGGPAADMTGAGQVAQRGARQWLNESAERSTRLYERVPIPPGTEAVVNNTRATLAELNAGMRSNPELGQIFDNPLLQRVQQALTPETDEAGAVVREGRLSWGDMTTLRTRVGDMLEDARLSPKIPERQLRALYGALSDDMEQTARGVGGGAYRRWRRANDFYRARQGRIDNAISSVLGPRLDRTANESFGAVERLMRESVGGDFARLGQVFRSMPRADAEVLRASLAGRAGGADGGFSPEQFAKDWGKVSDRAKSFLLPSPGARQMMDEAAAQATRIPDDPFAGKTGDDVVASINSMLQPGGDVAQARRVFGSLSPDDASAVRATFISRMGDAPPGAQNAAGNAFSPSYFLTHWNKVSDEGKEVLFGRTGGLRSALDDLALVAEGMKGAQRYAGFSNTGAVNSVNATTGGLAGSLAMLLTGNPAASAALASPAAYQAIMARAMTSTRLVKWMTRAAKQAPSDDAGSLRALRAIATREPQAASGFADIIVRSLEASPGRVAAREDEANGRPEPPQQQRP